MRILRKSLGLFLLGLPFAGLTVMMYSMGGMQAVIGCWGFVAVVLALIASGIYLLEG